MERSKYNARDYTTKNSRLYIIRLYNKKWSRLNKAAGLQRTIIIIFVQYDYYRQSVSISSGTLIPRFLTGL